MKTNIYTKALILLVSIGLFSFSTMNSKEVIVKESTVSWKGYRIGSHHEGTLALKDGKLKFEGDNLIGGSFVMDMNSLAVTDLPEGRRERLENHLKSDDFFSIENHPTASLEITNVESKDGKYNVTADLTIKGITNPISFEMKVGENTASASLKVDRTKYEIKFRSASFFDDLKDRAISDEFELFVTLNY